MMTIKQARIAKELTQEEVCALAHISHKTISRMENGKGTFNKSTFHVVCGVLGVDPKDIIGITIRGVK